MRRRVVPARTELERVRAELDSLRSSLEPPQPRQPLPRSSSSTHQPQRPLNRVAPRNLVVVSDSDVEPDTN